MSLKRPEILRKLDGGSGKKGGMRLAYLPSNAPADGIEAKLRDSANLQPTAPDSRRASSGSSRRYTAPASTPKSSVTLPRACARPVIERRGLPEQVANGIEGEQLFVAAADFRFRLLALGDVEKKPLIRDGGSCIVAGAKGGKVSRAYLAVATAELKFKIPDFAEFIEPRQSSGGGP